MITNFKLFENNQNWLIWNIKNEIDNKYPVKGGIGISVSSEKRINVRKKSISNYYYLLNKNNYMEKYNETIKDINNYLIDNGFRIVNSYDENYISYEWDLIDNMKKYNI